MTPDFLAGIINRLLLVLILMFFVHSLLRAFRGQADFWKAFKHRKKGWIYPFFVFFERGVDKNGRQHRQKYIESLKVTFKEFIILSIVFVVLSLLLLIYHVSN